MALLVFLQYLVFLRIVSSQNDKCGDENSNDYESAQSNHNFEPTLSPPSRGGGQRHRANRSLGFNWVRWTLERMDKRFVERPTKKRRGGKSREKDKINCRERKTDREVNRERQRRRTREKKINYAQRKKEKERKKKKERKRKKEKSEQ